MCHGHLSSALVHLRRDHQDNLSHALGGIISHEFSDVEPVFLGREGLNWDGAKFRRNSKAHQREAEMELIQMQNIGPSAEECPAVRLKGLSTLWVLLHGTSVIN